MLDNMNAVNFFYPFEMETFLYIALPDI